MWVSAGASAIIGCMYVVMRRIDHTQNMDRWYLVTVQSTLFHPTAVITAWGSGATTYQRLRVYPIKTRKEARRLAARIVKKKLGRGYRLVAVERKRR